MRVSRIPGFAALLPLLILPLLSGCVHYQGEGSVSTIVATSEAFKAFSGEFENTEYFKTHKPESIAVLPFAPLSGEAATLDDTDDTPEEIVRRGLYNHISSLPFNDLEIFSTDQRLKNAGLTTPDMINALIAENPRKLKSILGVDAAVTGEVTHFNRIFLGIYSQIAVGCETAMWDLKTGNLLWRAKHVSRAHAGGVSLNPVGLIMSAAASLWNLRATEMLSQTDEVFREIVSTIELPDSALALQARLPRIDLFAVLNAGEPFTAGQKVQFRLIGDGGAKAYVDIGDFKHAVSLNTVSPAGKQALQAELKASIRRQAVEKGYELTPELDAALDRELATREIYEGEYTVLPGEQAYGLLAKAYLVNASGDQKVALDVVHRVDIDAQPPDPPQQIFADPLDGKLKIAWDHPAADDLAGFELWRSASPLSGYSLWRRVEGNEAVVDGLFNFTPVYIKVRTVDRAGNQSPFSTPVTGTPLPRADLYDLSQPGPVLDGNLTAPVLLVSEKGPFLVQSTFRLGPGAVLHAAPGVVIRFMPDAALAIDGGALMVYGREDDPVRLGALAGEQTPGSWKGVFFNNAGSSRLAHIFIEHAETGISIENSALVILHATIRGCSQAGVHLKDNAAPTLTCSILADNSGQGAIVIEGEGVAPIIRDNTFEANTPFNVQSYTPMQVDVSGNFWDGAAPAADSFLGNIQFQPALAAPPSRCGGP